jgi:hypothetical protein
MTEYLDQPNPRTYPVAINGDMVNLNIHNIGVAMFRHRPECDYIDIHVPTDEGQEEHTLIFNRPELVVYLGGVALSKEQERILHLANRENGSFQSKYGWRPPTFIEDYPSDHELDMWVEANTPYDLHAELSENLKEDLDER